MRKVIVMFVAVTCCLLVFDVQSQKWITGGLRTPRIPNVKVAVPKVPKVPTVKPRIVNVGGLVKRARVDKFTPVVPRVRLQPLQPKSTYLFLKGLSQLQRDSITNLNNRSHRFLSHGIETRRVYHAITDSIDWLASRYDSLYSDVDSISSEEFAGIQAADSIFARYIIDRANGFPEQMLLWSRLLCEIYPHVVSKVDTLRPIDFDEVAEKRREYLKGDTLTFKQMYLATLARMRHLNGTLEFN